MAVERKDHRYHFGLEEIAKLLKLKGEVFNASVDTVVFADGGHDNMGTITLVPQCGCEKDKKKHVIIQTKEEIEIE